MRELRPAVLAGLGPISGSPGDGDGARLRSTGECPECRGSPCVRPSRSAGRSSRPDPCRRAGPALRGGEAHIILFLAGTSGIPPPPGSAGPAGAGPEGRPRPRGLARPQGRRGLIGLRDRRATLARPAPRIHPARPGAASGAYEGGGIKGILKECGLALAPSMVYLNGHSYVAHIGGRRGGQRDRLVRAAPRAAGDVRSRPRDAEPVGRPHGRSGGLGAGHRPEPRGASASRTDTAAILRGRAASTAALPRSRRKARFRPGTGR